MVDVDIQTGTRGFFGPGQTSQFGLTSATMFTLPKESILTLGEFVNRRPGSTTDLHALRGLLQTAIDEANREARIFSLEDDGDPILSSEGVPNADASWEIPPKVRPPNFFRVTSFHEIGSFLTTHTDTLRSRSYGTAGEGNTKVEAWCEAIIQRLPEYVDPSDSAADIPAAGSVNDRFGREIYRCLVLSDEGKSFPPGAFRFVNLSPSRLRFAMGEQTLEVPSGSIKVLKKVDGVREDGRFPYIAQYHDSKTWNRLSTGYWTSHPRIRSLQVVYFDPRTKRLTLRGFDDKLMMHTPS